MMQVANVCHHVTRLTARQCIGLNMTNVRGFPELRALDLTGCDSIAPTGVLPTLEAWTTLEEVILDSCILLTHVQLTMPRLRSLHLQGCRGLLWVRAPPWCHAAQLVAFLTTRCVLFPSFFFFSSDLFCPCLRK